MRKLQTWLFLFAFGLLAKGGGAIMTEQQKRIFATTYVHLILNGRRTIDEVPAIIRDIVMADLGMTETTE